MSALPRAALALVVLPALACGLPKRDRGGAQAKPADRETLEAVEKAAADRRPPPKWKRDAPKMPDAFLPFAKPDFASLDGLWVVQGEIPDRRELWVVEASESKLTIVDHRGRARVHGVGLLSPCSLRLFDVAGHSSTRQLAMTDAGLHLAFRGAVAVEGEDGRILACVESQVYELGAEGGCVLHSEMLGVWEERDAEDEDCQREDDGSLRFGQVELEPVEGEKLWLDARAAEGLARRFEDRAKAEAALTASAAPDSAAPDSGDPDSGGANTGGANTGDEDEVGADDGEGGSRAAAPGAAAPEQPVDEPS